MMVSLSSYSQDCANFWDVKRPQDEYQLVPSGCHSMLISNNEFMTVVFPLIKGRDYRLSVNTNHPTKKAIFKIYSDGGNVLLYNNYEMSEDTTQIFEFEQRETYIAMAIVTLIDYSIDDNTYTDVLKPKTIRYCVGIKVETMITKK